MCSRNVDLAAFASGASVAESTWTLETTTFVAALRHDWIIAPMTIECPMNGAIFRAYVERFLVRELSLGDVVIMNNLSLLCRRGFAAIGTTA